MNDISASAAAAREASRERTGQFGEQHKDASTAAFPGTEQALTRAFVDSQADEITSASREERVNVLFSELETAYADLDKDDNWQRFLDVSSTSMRNYSATNRMLLQVQTGGRASIVAAASVWDQLGRHPKKGEKALWVLGPISRKVEEKDANGNPKLDADGKPIRRDQLVGFKSLPTFDVSQTDGDPLPETFHPLTTEPPEGFIEDMEAAANAAGFEVEYKDLMSYSDGVANGAHGWADGDAKKITIDSSMPPGARARTLAHELGHVYAGHCDPEHSGKYHSGPGGCRGQFETEAESIGYLLSRTNNLDVQDSKISAQYIASWSRQDPKLLKESMNNVSTATNKILSSVPFRNVEADPLADAKAASREAYKERVAARKTGGRRRRS